MRCAALVLFSVVLLLGLAAAPRVYAQDIDPNDNFDDGVLSPNWIPWPLPSRAYAPVETGGRVVLTVPPDSTSEWSVDSNLYSSWVIRGPFDIQVDYQLLDWPAHSSAMAGITLNFPGESDSTMRASGRGQADDGTDETYTFNYRDDYCSCDGQIATTDTVGKLRVTRDADSILTSYYWSAAANDWVVFNTRPVPADDAHVTLLLWGVVPEPGMSVAFDNFQVNSGEVIPFGPAIEDVVIDRGRDSDRWDWAPWHQRFTVQVKGTEYEQPACILIEDAQGTCRWISTCNGDGCWASTNPGGSCDSRVTTGPDYTYTYTWYEDRKEYPLPEGSYCITVVGDAGSWPTLKTVVAPAVSEDGPVLLAPGLESVIDTTTPTFEWTPLPGSEQTLQVRAEGATNYTGPAREEDDCGQIWRADVGTQASAVYNFDGTGPDLEPGRTYFWQVSAWIPIDDRVTDTRVSLWEEQTARDRFTIDTTWPALPDLPGRLAYEQTMYGDTYDPYNLQAILQYGTTPAERTWVGPDASHTPSYSWDGTKIAYRISDWGIRVANADGSDPVRLPAMWGWYGADFSPDATWVAYADGEWQGSEPQHIFIQKLFEPERTLLVLARGNMAWDPHWSPDGVWISYLSCCESSGNYVWLVHPDGTDDHPLLPTGMVGYPGATVTWFAGTPAWSPDAMRLGVGFNFTTTEGESFSGIGTMSRDGGEITPVWLNPPGVVCCAGASFETWSPDGASIVFRSAHQMPVDADWINGKFEPGVELWLISADGSGEPTRLTYDYSHNPSAAWWAPNALVGKGVSVVKGAATLTFAQVTAEGSTRMHVTDDVPGAAPEGYALTGDLWSGATTAGYRADIAVALPYDAGLAGQEDSLALMRWNPEKEKWQDITARPIDVTNRIIRGRTKDLGVFAVCVRTR